MAWRLPGLILLLGAQPALADASPPRISASFARPTLTDAPVKIVQMGSLAISLEHTTLAQIIRAIGSGVIRHQGDASESVYWICYTIPSSEQAQRVWISSGELGGSHHRVDGFIQATQSEATTGGADGSCPELRPPFRAISFDHHAVLGASEKDLTGWFGKSSGQQEDWLFYNSEKTVKGWATLGTLAARMDGGKVSTVFVSSVTTN